MHPWNSSTELSPQTSKEALIIPRPRPIAVPIFKEAFFRAALRYSIILTFHDVIVFETQPAWC